LTKNYLINKATNFFLLLFLLVTSLEISTASAQTTVCKNKIFFVAPFDGYISDKKEVFFEFGKNNISIDPAGKIPPKSNDVCFISGHHHLIINDVYEPSAGVSIPFKENVYHFGGGQTSAIISLDPGKYSLQLVLGDYTHMPINQETLEENFIVSKKIFIEILN
jgi:hypothetical protein